MESAPGRGTTFDIYLPATDRPVLKEREAAEAIGGRENILLVDDEEVIRCVGRDMFITPGYQVMLASRGEEAVDLYTQNRDRIEFVSIRKP